MGMWADIDTTARPEPAAIVQARERPSTEIFYGGPDQPPRALRDLLKSRVDAAPPGSEIIWATYYFRDQALAESLVAAQQRGVRVRVRLEGSPRSGRANDQVIKTLHAGLGDDLRLHRGWFGISHLHAKIYAFTGPQSESLIGSFNPSGDDIPDPKVMAEIGDQDRGENLLVAFREPEIARALRRQAERLWSGKGTSRFARRENRPVKFADARLYYFPRLRPDVVDRRIARLGPGDSVQAAISHMDQGPFARQLAEAAERGAVINLVVHDTQRRMPTGLFKDLSRAGVTIRRYCDAQGLPMHAKFVVIDHGGQRSAWFGSFNYNATSRYFNQEVLARSTNTQIIDDLETRFRKISDEAGQRANACDRATRTAMAAPAP